MRLADDTRGRVPFALIGVLLLLGSTTYATTLATEGVRVDRDVEVAMDRATAASETALRTAVSRAARDAAGTPVVDPADNGWGEVLNDSRPFRDSLRVRIYVAARAGFERAAYTHGDVTAAASLPATPTPGDLSRELERVSVRSVENGTAVEVRVRDVSVVARRGGAVVARETTNATVTVATPVLALHDRTVRFEESLTRGPLEGPGLGRRLTARLYPVAWARGYGQWGGAPISNVVGTRHVGIATNGAVLQLQQAAYGRADPTGRAAQRRAFERLLLADARAGMSTPGTSLVTSVAPPPTPDPDDVRREVPRLARADAPTPDRETVVRVDDTADRAYVALQSGDGGPSLDEVLERAYGVNLTLRTESTLVDAEPWPHPRPPGPRSTLVDESVSSSATVEPGSASLPPRTPNATRFRAATRHVTVRHHFRRTWRRGNTTVETTATATEQHAVGVAVDGTLRTLDGVPTNPVVPAFEAGGALDGPNLAGVPAEADAFLAARGGVENVVAQRVLDGPEALDRTETVSGERPAALREWVVADLLDLHRVVRNTSTSVRMGDAATARANPSANLTERLDARRDTLVDAPPRYDGVADRARVAARVAYLTRIDARLSDRSNATVRANDRLAAVLRERHVDLEGWAAEVVSTRTSPPPDPRPVGGPLGGEDVFVPQGGPPYLDVQGVDRADAPWTARHGTEHPLRTRNVNVFTVPYGDAVDGVFGGSRETVRLHTAAVTLRAAERTDAFAPTARPDTLRDEVAESVTYVGERTRAVLDRETALSRAERRRAVDDAFATWNRTSAKALAVTNGSFVPRVVAEAGLSGREAERVRVHLRVAVAAARDSDDVRVHRDHVDGTASAVRRLSKTAATEALGTAVANGTDRLAARTEGKAVVLPAGLPLLPTPTNWYATVNVWDVHVRGYYPRFAVRTQRGSPGETVTYVRDGGCAALDLDEDGADEELGCASRVDISVRTVVLVAVPPGKTGVGDTDGQAVEDSPGWGMPYPWERRRGTDRRPSSGGFGTSK
jgi:hypothetical protein